MARIVVMLGGELRQELDYSLSLTFQKTGVFKAWEEYDIDFEMLRNDESFKITHINIMSSIIGLDCLGAQFFIKTGKLQASVPLFGPFKKCNYSKFFSCVDKTLISPVDIDPSLPLSFKVMFPFEGNVEHLKSVIVLSGVMRRPIQ